MTAPMTSESTSPDLVVLDDMPPAALSRGEGPTWHDWVGRYRRTGHVTVPAIFSPAQMQGAIADAMAWSAAFLEQLDDAKRAWYLDNSASRAEAQSAVLRKLDNPHANRPLFRRLAAHRPLLDCVETLIGRGVSAYFSQIFMKPPHGGGPKPVHQDNYYFGPADPDGMVTAWIALEDADLENGCLHYAEGSHLHGIVPHEAPPERPYDLLIPPARAATREMVPAPVPAGGVSFHHGGTWHQSADNRSDRWRRACAIHYVRNGNRFAHPALPYDESLVLRLT
ncbi:phytanoyl-CoA dioxygenase family protein [Marinibaculum pumilum]|uniref:Phytanoyl-CoA dioxygenase family protein n=1 Tax=Marinibaculum pumilum TaxID=1766165 RepID=A0ABV7L5U3_9PROT